MLSKRPGHIYIIDPTFNIAPERAKAILRIFIKYNRDTRLHVELRAELLDEEMIRLLDQAKCYYIEIGLQSINSKTLRLINRDFNAKRFKDNMHLISKFNKGCRIEIQLIDSLPGETYQDFLKSVNWAFSLRPSRINIMRLCVLPGSALRGQAKRFGITYSPRPPYHSYKSGSMSRDDLKKIEKLRIALGLLFNNQLIREVLYPLTECLRISFSDILEEWDMEGLRPGRDVFPHFLNFVKRMCKKYGKSHYYEKLRRLIISEYSFSYYEIARINDNLFYTRL